MKLSQIIQRKIDDMKDALNHKLIRNHEIDEDERVFIEKMKEQGLMK